jgi:CHAD domain-containing protein
MRSNRSPERAAATGEPNASLLADRIRGVQLHEAALPDVDAVHEMRVATRRLRAALRLLRLRKLDHDVKTLQDALGDVRDLQLQVEWLRGRDAGLQRSCAARLTKAKNVLRRQLRLWRSRTLTALLEAAAEGPHVARLSKLLRKRLRRLQQRLERARARPTAASLHAARVSVKQVRYLVEVARRSLPKKVTRLEADLKTLQASLGELHDVDARLDLVKSKPALARDQEETRKRLSKVAAAQLARWHKQRLIDRASAALH